MSSPVLIGPLYGWSPSNMTTTCIPSICMGDWYKTGSRKVATSGFPHCRVLRLPQPVRCAATPDVRPPCNSRRTYGVGHKDTFDRIFVSQAILESLTLITCDSAFGTLRALKYVWWIRSVFSLYDATFLHLKYVACLACESPTEPSSRHHMSCCRETPPSLENQEVQQRSLVNISKLSIFFSCRHD